MTPLHLGPFYDFAIICFCPLPIQFAQLNITNSTTFPSCTYFDHNFIIIDNAEPNDQLIPKLTLWGIDTIFGINLSQDTYQITNLLTTHKYNMAECIDILYYINEINQNRLSYYETKLQLLISKVQSFLSHQNLCKSHNLTHMMNVMNSCKQASQHIHIPLKYIHILLCAALLHDIDDRKLFPNNKNYENLRLLMCDYDVNDVNLAIEMVSYVSCAQNGDTVTDRAREFDWLLYPRHADRLEAMGLVGIARCYQYTKTLNRILFTEDTELATNEAEVWAIATAERYMNYKGNSKCMMSHYYDKLLRLGKFETSNPYFNEMKKDKMQPMLDVVIKFGLTHEVDVEYMEELVRDYL